MPGVARIGDKAAGHTLPATLVGSSDVFANSKGIHRQGDGWPPHDSPLHAGATTTTGSSTVFVNGSAIARIGDPISCGTTIGEGSSNVFAG